MALYYKGEYVTIKREYEYAGIPMVEILFKNETLYVKRSDLTDEPVYDRQEVKKIKENKDEKEIVSSKEDLIPKQPKKDYDQPIYIAKANDGKTTIKFKTVEDKQVKKYNFDSSAIARVINGEQKSHKNFTFELE